MVYVPLYSVCVAPAIVTDAPLVSPCGSVVSTVAVVETAVSFPVPITVVAGVDAGLPRIICHNSLQIGDISTAIAPSMTS